MTDNNRQVYFSYAWGGESERIVNELDADLQSKGIQVIRDKRDLGFKGSIRDFMQEIGRGHAVIVIISDKYLKSPNCMFELVEISKSKDIHDRIFPIVLADADIYNPVNRIKYIKHWEDKLKELDEAMKTVSSANLQGMREEIDSYDEIRDNISNLTFILKDMNTLTPEMHENSNFATLISMLEKRLANTGNAPAGSPAPAPAKPATPAPATPAASAAADFSAYLDDISKRLRRDDYEELRGERYGEIRFKAVYQLVRKGFLGATEHFQVLVVEMPGVDANGFIDLEKQIKKYADELCKELVTNLYVTCVILTNHLPEDVAEMIYETKPPKVGLTDVSIVVMVAYDAAKNDIAYQKDLPEDYESNFKANIKQYLMP